MTSVKVSRFQVSGEVLDVRDLFRTKKERMKVVTRKYRFRFNVMEMI